MSQKEVSRYFRVGRTTTSRIIKDVCAVLWEVLAPREMKPPDSTDWKAIAEEFDRRWNFPHCLGMTGA